MWQWGCCRWGGRDAATIAVASFALVFFVLWPSDAIKFVKLVKKGKVNLIDLKVQIVSIVVTL